MFGFLLIASKLAVIKAVTANKRSAIWGAWSSRPDRMGYGMTSEKIEAQIGLIALIGTLEVIFVSG